MHDVSVKSCSKAAPRVRGPRRPWTPTATPSVPRRLHRAYPAISLPTLKTRQPSSPSYTGPGISRIRHRTTNSNGSWAWACGADNKLFFRACLRAALLSSTALRAWRDPRLLSTISPELPCPYPRATSASISPASLKWSLIVSSSTTPRPLRAEDALDGFWFRTRGRFSSRRCLLPSCASLV